MMLATKRYHVFKRFISKTHVGVMMKLVFDAITYKTPLRKTRGSIDVSKFLPVRRRQVLSIFFGGKRKLCCRYSPSLRPRTNHLRNPGVKWTIDILSGASSPLTLPLHL